MQTARPAGGASTGRRRGNNCSSTAGDGSGSRRSCGRKYERRQGKGRTAMRSETYSQMSGARVPSWTSYGPQRWEAGWDLERRRREWAERQEGWEGGSRARAWCASCLFLFCVSLSLFFFLSLSFSFSLSLFLSLSLFFFLSLSLSFSLSLFLSVQWEARQGQGELRRAVGGLWEVAADGEQERTVYNIVTIQSGRTRLMNHHHHQQEKGHASRNSKEREEGRASTLNGKQHT